MSADRFYTALNTYRLHPGTPDYSAYTMVELRDREWRGRADVPLYASHYAASGLETLCQTMNALYASALYAGEKA